jgi:hypothetical protein
MSGSTTVLRKGSDGRLWCGQGREARAVTVRRCFPWSHPSNYVSLRDEQDAEVALVRHPDDLDGASREVFEAALAEAGFLLEVSGVESIDEEVEVRHWRVVTRQGPRSFQTRLDEWPRRLPGGGFLLRDISGDLYRLPVPETMDEKSRELLWAFID